MPTMPAVPSDTAESVMSVRRGLRQRLRQASLSMSVLLLQPVEAEGVVTDVDVEVDALVGDAGLAPRLGRRHRHLLREVAPADVLEIGERHAAHALAVFVEVALVDGHAALP